MSNLKKHHLPMQRSNDRCRTKSARKKRKSVMEDVETDSKRRFVEVDVLDMVELSRPVHFVVPMLEAGRYGEDKYQERKYLGLIEGVGGGIGKRLVPLFFIGIDPCYTKKAIPLTIIQRKKAKIVTFHIEVV